MITFRAKSACGRAWDLVLRSKQGIIGFFEDADSAKRLWSSIWVGGPLWVISAFLAAYWLYHVPVPGFAIGALATVAGIMSVREMKTSGKISWVSCSLSYLISSSKR